MSNENITPDDAVEDQIEGTVETPTEAVETEQVEASEETPNREAAKYRLKLREAETQRDAAQDTIKRLQDTIVADLISALGFNPAGVMQSTEISALLNEDGDIDPELVKKVATETAEKFGLERKPQNPLLRGALSRVNTPVDLGPGKFEKAFSPKHHQ